MGPEKVEAALASYPEARAVLDLLAQDIVSTIGSTREDALDFVLETAAGVLDFIDDPSWRFERCVVDNVQQRMHDEYIDTDWPECPVHRGHPLWLRGPPWSWRCDGVSIPLGKLGSA